MLKGKSTSELYEKCLKSGLCKEHLKYLEVADNNQSYECEIFLPRNTKVQRQAFLYIRLQIFGPILFHRPFSSDKMKALFSASVYFRDRDSPEQGEDFKDEVLILDAIVVFTLCHFCKVVFKRNHEHFLVLTNKFISKSASLADSLKKEICCVGALFLPSHKESVSSSEENILLMLLTKKKLEEGDIRYLLPLLQENFRDTEGNNDGLLKFCYVTTLLFVRNVTMNLKLKQALEQQQLEFKSISKESETWNEIGTGAFKQQYYTEAVNAYTSGLKYSPYCISLLQNRAEAFLRLDKYKDYALDNYVILMINPTAIEAFLKFATSLHHQSLFRECVNAAKYGLEKCKVTDDPDFYQSLELVMKDAENAALRQEKLACESHTYLSLCEMKEENEVREEINVAASKETEIVHTQRSISEEPEKKDIPELIEASDSESEIPDVPDLMEASNSEQSDSESELSEVSDAFCATPLRHHLSREVSESRSSTPSVNIQMNLEESKDGGPAPKTRKLESVRKVSAEEKIKLVQQTLREASKTLLDGCGLSAVRRFREALDEIKNFPEMYKYEDCDIVCIKYAFGMAYCKSAGYDDLQRAIAVFKEITEVHSSITFPAAYYGIGFAYHKLNRFKDALHYLKIVDDILQRGILIKVYAWPELTTAIEETKSDSLKTLLSEILRECENPPVPNATCRFEECSLQPGIYYTDPDFKGFFTMQCSDQCCLQFHPNCWKLLKTSKKCTDKEFLEQKCTTPDCEGIIIKIQNITKEGNVGKEFSISDSKKITKQKKTKLEKKLEVKEKKRKRKDSSSKTDAVSEAVSDVLIESQPGPETDSNLKDNKSEREKIETKEKSESSSVPNVSQLSANAEPFIVLKKEKFINESSIKISSKIKEQKKTKNTYSIDEFLQGSDIHGSEYHQRLNVLRQNNQSAVEGHWSTGNKSPVDIQPTPYTIEDFRSSLPAPLVSTDVHNSISEADDKNSYALKTSSTLFQPQVEAEPHISFECIKKNIYSYFKELLGRCGPIRVDDSFLIKELEDFPCEANIIIADCGGIGEFLQMNVDFAFVGETYVCLVDQLPLAYKKISSSSACLHSDNISLMDNFGVYDLNEKTNSDMFKYSYLNPDAKEYMPPEKVDRNSPKLISAISRLRQPLTVDEESSIKSNGESTVIIASTKNDTPPSEGYSAGCLNVKTVSKFLRVNDENGYTDTISEIQNTPKKSSKFDSLISTAKFLNDKKSSLEVKQLEFARKCTEAIQVYFSVEANECRSYIDACLKPYSIMEIPKKNSKCVQTENTKVEKVSTGTMKTDDELQRLKDITACLNEDRLSLLEKTKMLEGQCDSALDSATKYQKKSNVELANLRKELEDSNAELEQYKKDSKSRESKLEKEVKFLSESLKKSKEENSAHKSEMDKMSSVTESLKTLIEEQVENVRSLQTNEQKLRKSLGEAKDCQQNLETDRMQNLIRAKNAELLLLRLKKTEFLKRIDSKTAEAVQRMKELQEGILVSGNLNPVYTKNFEALLSQIQKYITKLGGIRIGFVVLIDEQINEINNGTPLSSLKTLEVKELPEIPSFTSHLPVPNAMPNSQPPSWTPAQLQMLNSAVNSTSINAFQLPSANNLSTKFAMQPNQQSLPQRTDPLSIPAGMPESISKPEANQNQSSLPAKKLPPGLKDPLLPLSSYPPSAVPQSLPKRVSKVAITQSKTNLEKTKPPTSSRSSLASNSSLDARESECSDSPSLELGYNVKKSKTPEKTSPAAAAAASNIKSPKAKPNNQEPKNSYEKLLQKLQLKFPTHTQLQLMAFVKEFRQNRKNGLSGLAMDNIISQISEMIEAKIQAENKGSETGAKSRAIQNKVLVNKKLALDESKAQESMQENQNKKKYAWGKSDSDASKQWSGKGIDEGCIICYEEMTHQTAYKVDCGHTFHLKCIREWLNKKSDCPICRVHLLLPEDYPALS